MPMKAKTPSATGGGPSIMLAGMATSSATVPQPVRRPAIMRRGTTTSPPQSGVADSARRKILIPRRDPLANAIQAISGARLEIKYRLLAELKPDPKNAREHSDDQ